MAQKGQKTGRYYGGGMPKGHKTAKVLEKEAAREILREQLTAHMGSVAEALVSRCKGVRYFVTRNAKTGKYELVTDPDAVVAALNQEDQFSGEFYTDKPETAAIKEFFDRALDKAVQPMKVNAEVNLNVNLTDRLEAGRKRLLKAKRG